MSDKTIKVALAGAGAFGIKHLDGIRNIDGVEVVSLVSRELDKTKEVAAKYAKDSSAQAKLVEKVKKGGQGVWGQVPMPPNAQVPDADVQALVKWILSQK